MQTLNSNYLLLNILTILCKQKTKLNKNTHLSKYLNADAEVAGAFCRQTELWENGTESKCCEFAANATRCRHTPPNRHAAVVAEASSATTTSAAAQGGSGALRRERERAWAHWKKLAPHTCKELGFRHSRTPAYSISAELKRRVTYTNPIGEAVRPLAVWVWWEWAALLATLQAALDPRITANIEFYSRTRVQFAFNCCVVSFVWLNWKALTPTRVCEKWFAL